ncbi:MAG: dimethyl sulfoxide reductase anchor subunit family protein [Candidatus Puniceispirillaceae bacterium]|jgi:DMSO reductase anchor subunit
MRPAWSIIFFTSISGLGFGLAAWLVLGFVDLANPQHLLITGIATMALIVAGLLSSTFHLGHPERAWRALTQWRSSWLSREGVLAVLALIAMAVWGLYYTRHGAPPVWANGLIAALMALTVYATSMIYASLRTVARWHHPLTPVCYLMFAASSGLVAVLWVLAVLGQQISPPLLLSAMLAVASAWGIKIIWWQLAGAGGSGSSLATATGLGSLGTVRSIMPPHTSENYLQHEMGFVVARKHAAQLRVMALLVGGVLPMALLFLLAPVPLVLGVAVIAHMAGIFVERWLFFAEAKHSVTLYYGDTH